jgi:hypothetical protein
MSESENTQDGLSANIGRLYGVLSKQSWGAYPGECDYARRERLREPKPKPPYPDQQTKPNDDGMFPY